MQEGGELNVYSRTGAGSRRRPKRQTSSLVFGSAIAAMALSACTSSSEVAFEPQTAPELAQLIPIEPSDDYITSSASAPRGMSSCKDPGAYEASTSGTDVVITAKWSTSCTASYELEIHLSHDGSNPVAARSQLTTVLDGELVGRDTAITVQIAEFDPEGVISGRWGDSPFWVVVDRPTLVTLSDGLGELARGQFTMVDGCFIQSVEPSDATISAAVRTFGACDDVEVAVTDVEFETLGAVATIAVSSLTGQ